MVTSIHAEIAAEGGWIPFARYMELALYAPGLGYYSAGAAKLGAQGDFTTASEMTPLFGAALARQVRAILDASAAREVFELGAGTGQLAASLLRALHDLGALPARYLILEPSPELRARQRETLASVAPQHLGVVDWVRDVPEAIDGAVIANEVLDAVPAHVVRRDGDAWFERGVSVRAPAIAPHYGLDWEDRPAPGWLRTMAQARFPDVLQYVSEITPAAAALVAHVARRLRGGAALFIDYGFPAREYYHPQRTSGTLMCHYRHRAHDDPFYYPGLCDITAHVDFTAMAAAGTRAGLQVAGFCPQAPFLLGCGILDALAGVGPPESIDFIKAAGPVQKLLSPAEMGDLFKVLALTASADVEWPGFALAGHRYRL